MTRYLIALTALIAFTALILAACATEPPTCYELTTEYRSEIDIIVERYSDAFDIASSTSRISLSGPIATLQDIRRDTRRITPPECAETAHSHLIRAMDYSIDGFLAFLSQESESQINLLFTTSSTAMREFNAEYIKILEDAP